MRGHGTGAASDQQHEERRFALLQVELSLHSNARYIAALNAAIRATDMPGACDSHCIAWGS